MIVKYVRLISKRDFGGIIFLTFIDFIKSFQVKVKKTSSSNFSNAKSLNLGDIVKLCFFSCSFSYIFTFEVFYLVLDSKNFFLYPDKKKNIVNKSFYYSKNYIKIATSLKKKSEIYIRFKVFEYIRLFMYKNNFLEVDTPIINSNTESSDSEPFVVYSNSLKKNMYLRISPEINLKKILISGFNSIFEIGKNFRNESFSIKHYPEFSFIEFYKVGKNYFWCISFLEFLLKDIFFRVLSLSLINSTYLFLFYKSKFDYFDVIGSIIRYTDLSFENVIDKKFMFHKLVFLGFDVDFHQLTLYQLLFLYFEKVIQKKLIYPTFILYFPIQDSPLAKSKNIFLAERFELYISGIEISNGFTELNCHFEQERRFLKQSINNNKLVNYDFINALKFGMPSSTGCGIGIDRLLMVILNKPNIRDVIVFPDIRGG